MNRYIAIGILCIVLTLGLIGVSILPINNASALLAKGMCADTDGGIEYYVKGTAYIVGGSTSVTDVCSRDGIFPSPDFDPSGPILIESYCDKGTVKITLKNCGCHAGKCVLPQNNF